MSVNFPGNKLPSERLPSKNPAQATPSQADQKMARMAGKILSPAPVAHSDVSNKNQKRNFVRFILGKFLPSLSDMDDLMQQRKGLELTALTMEIPELFPELNLKQQIAMQNALIEEWFKLIIGHEWGIKASVMVAGKKIQSEGNFPALTTHLGAGLISAFNDSQESGGVLPQESLRRVKDGVIAGAFAAYHTEAASGELLRSVSNVEGKNRHAGEELFAAFQKNGIIAIPTGWHRHSIGLTLHQAQDGKCYLYYCNRGARGAEISHDRAIMQNQLGQVSYDMICWEIGKKEAITPELMTKILGMQWTGGAKGEEQNKIAKPFLEGRNGLFAILGLKNPVSIPKKAQKVGNCSWANYKGSIHGAFIAAAVDEGLPIAEAIKKGTILFKRMERFGRESDLQQVLSYDARELTELITEFDHVRILRAAAKKLSGKEAEAWNDPAIRERDGRMKKQVMAYFQTCPYEVRYLSHALSPEIEIGLLLQLYREGEGAFVFSNGSCFFLAEGKIRQVPMQNPQERLKAFIERQRKSFPPPAFTMPFLMEEVIPLTLKDLDQLQEIEAQLQISGAPEQTLKALAHQMDEVRLSVIRANGFALRHHPRFRDQSLMDKVAVDQIRLQLEKLAQEGEVRKFIQGVAEMASFCRWAALVQFDSQFQTELNGQLESFLDKLLDRYSIDQITTLPLNLSKSETEDLLELLLTVQSRLGRSHEGLKQRIDQLTTNVFDAQLKDLKRERGDYAALKEKIQQLKGSLLYQAMRDLKNPLSRSILKDFENLALDADHNASVDQMHEEAFQEIMQTLEPEAIRRCLVKLDNEGVYIEEGGDKVLVGTPQKWKLLKELAKAKLALLEPASIASCSLQEADRLLSNQPEGSWLIRKSAQPGMLTVSYVDAKQQVIHSRIAALLFTNPKTFVLNQGEVSLELQGRMIR